MTDHASPISVKVERLEGHKVKLDVTVDREEVKKAHEQAYRRLARRVTIPGFRPGKAPRQVLQSHLGAETVRREALDLILPDSYGRALDSQGLQPIDSPEVEVVTFKEGEPLVFTATVEVKPEVRLGRYKGLGLKVEPEPVKEEDVERQLKAMAERAAQIEPAAEGTRLTDGLFAVLDIHGTVDGETFPGGDSEGVMVQLGAGQMEPEMEKALEGATAGETREAVLSFPDDHPNPALAGKEARFEITVKEVKTKKVPELTDDLAREIAGTDVAGLKERVTESLEEAAKRNAADELRRRLVEKVVDEAEVDVPETLVNRRVERKNAEIGERLERQGLTVDNYIKMVGLDRETWERDLRARAEREVKRELVLEAVADREGIEVTDAEVEFEIVRLAYSLGEKPDKVRKLFVESPSRLESLRERIRMDKTVHYLVEANSAADEAADGGAQTPDEPPSPGSAQTPDEPSSAAGAEDDSTGRGEQG
ncbi:MAG TPA: trigger factor [Clostridiales bacterium]|nr:trigger factor [Clostridiales bacterium]